MFEQVIGYSASDNKSSWFVVSNAILCVHVHTSNRVALIIYPSGNLAKSCRLRVLEYAFYAGVNRCCISGRNLDRLDRFSLRYRCLSCCTPAQPADKPAKNTM